MFYSLVTKIVKYDFMKGYGNTKFLHLVTMNKYMPYLHSHLILK